VENIAASRFHPGSEGERRGNEATQMKVQFAALVIVSTLGGFAAPALAQQTSDDVKWITQCVADNKDEGQTAPVVLSYCTCMNNKMSNNETRSITQWEKANPNAAEACGRQAGWKGK
jgi:hypothetical protein